MLLWYYKQLRYCKPKTTLKTTIKCTIWSSYLKTTEVFSFGVVVSLLRPPGISDPPSRWPLFSSPSGETYTDKGNYTMIVSGVSSLRHQGLERNLTQKEVLFFSILLQLDDYCIIHFEFRFTWKFYSVNSCSSFHIYPSEILVKFFIPLTVQ